MALKIIWSTEARVNFDDIVDWLKFKWGEKSAGEFVKRVNESLELVKQRPRTFPLIRPGQRIRKFQIVKQVALYYQVNGEVLELITLFDHRQNPQKLRKYFKRVRVFKNTGVGQNAQRSMWHSQCYAVSSLRSTKQPRGVQTVRVSVRGIASFLAMTGGLYCEGTVIFTP